MITFRTLGTLELTAADGRDVSALLTQPKRVALLTYLLLARPRGLRQRDTLLAMFWPELDQLRGRHALNQALHFLRTKLGNNVMLTRGAEAVGINADCIQCDVVLFEEALARRDLVAALTAYEDHLLPGFYISESPEFEQWLEGERLRLRRSAAEAARVLADQCIAAGQLMEAARWAAHGAYLEPLDEKMARRLMRTLDRIGDRAGAISVFQNFSRRLLSELGVAPSPETCSLEATIRAREETWSRDSGELPVVAPASMRHR